MIYPIQSLLSHDILTLLDNRLKPLEDVESIGSIMLISFVAIVGPTAGSNAYLTSLIEPAAVSIDLQSQKGQIDSKYKISDQGELSVTTISSSPPLSGTSNQELGYEI